MECSGKYAKSVDLWAHPRDQEKVISFAPAPRVMLSEQSAKSVPSLPPSQTPPKGSVQSKNFSNGNPSGTELIKPRKHIVF